jgi:aspartyl-tRNA(Asn)/glutamyl-tRNA(Gln) amidotransferase subunit C
VIDDRTVAHVARLSRLELTDDERELFRAQLGSILEHFQSLLALDLSGEAADAALAAGAGSQTATRTASDPQPLGAANVLRDDSVRPCLPLDDVLGNAPQSEDGFFIVPPVIEGE